MLWHLPSSTGLVHCSSCSMPLLLRLAGCIRSGNGVLHSLLDVDAWILHDQVMLNDHGPWLTCTLDIGIPSRIMFAAVSGSSCDEHQVQQARKPFIMNLTLVRATT